METESNMPVDQPNDDPEGASVHRLDLGALLIPAIAGTEVQLQVAEESGVVSQASIVFGDAMVQLQPFAAPKSGGMWDEIREQLEESIRSAGGTVVQAEGPFGAELRAQVPGERGLQPARFVGLEGPRWFLRAVFLGGAAQSGPTAEVLEAALRGVEVVRDDQARAVGSLLPLRLPETEVAPGTSPERFKEVSPFDRGPEITEIR